jgi:hypothetical protein
MTFEPLSKSSPCYEGAPVIAMSGNHELGASALEFGANAFLPKPLARGAVAERVGALIQAAA